MWLNLRNKPLPVVGAWRSRSEIGPRGAPGRGWLLKLSFLIKGLLEIANEPKKDRRNP
jgi:hypothetical protein